MTAATLNTARTFAADEQGSIAILFALKFVVLLTILGVAIDYGRAVHADQRLSSAMDAAALSAGRALIDGQLTDDEVRDRALSVLEENFKAGGASFATLDGTEITMNRATGAVTIRTTAVVPTTITAIANVDRFTMPRTASAIFDQRDIELGIQLDVTGSMGGQKIIDLRKALNGEADINSRPEDQGLFDILLPDQPGSNKVRIGLAPYAAGVNLGPALAATVTDNRNAGSACVYDRVGSNVSDDLHGPGNFFKGRADLPGAQPCPATAVVPLSKGTENPAERQRLKDVVKTFNAKGTTAGQIGTNWAWNLISPKWKTVWPVAAPAEYGNANTIKAVILMTDGEYNTVDGQCDNGGCTPSGTRGRKANDDARALCEQMKQQGVIVYTVGFQLNHPVALETLNRCATSNRTYFLAQNGGQLRDAFRDIANQLNNLRLTQ